MEKEDWQHIAKWIGWVYLPIIILAVVVFLLVEWNAYKVAPDPQVLGESKETSTTPRLQ